MLQTSPAAFSSIEEDVHPFRHCNTNIIISFLPHYFNMWIYTQAACIHFHLNQYLRQRQQSDRKPYTYMRKKRNTRTKTGDHSGREHLQDSWKVIMQNWQGLLPGGSEEACYLVAKACIVGMFHDGHELNAVVTWRQNHKWMQLTRHSLQFLRIRTAFPNECNSLTCNPGLWTSSSLFLRLLFTQISTNINASVWIQDIPTAHKRLTSPLFDPPVLCWACELGAFFPPRAAPLMPRDAEATGKHRPSESQGHVRHCAATTANCLHE